MSSPRRPDSDEECDYPHPPPRVFREAPLTPGEILWAAVTPGVIFGAVIGGSVGLCLGSVLGADSFPPSSTIEVVILMVLFVLAGAAAGGTIFGMVLCGLVAFLFLVETLFELVTRPFRSKVDADADLGDPW